MPGRKPKSLPLVVKVVMRPGPPTPAAAAALAALWVKIFGSLSETPPVDAKGDGDDGERSDSVDNDQTT